MSDFDITDRALGTLKRLGAQGMVTHQQSRSVECEVREQRVEKLQDSQAAALTVQIFVDGRYGVHTTNDVRAKELDSFLANAVKLTQLLDADPERTLPDPSLCATNKELPLVDPGYDGLSSEERKRWAKALEASARKDKRVVSATGSFSDESGRTIIAASNGLRAAQSQTMYFASTGVTVEEGDKRPEEYAYTSGRSVKALGSADDIGKQAMDRTLARIGAKKLKSGETTLIIENRTAGRLLGAFLGAAMGQTLQQKRSFLEGASGKLVMSKIVTLLDDPTIVDGMGARSFDGEGLRANKLSLIDGGVLKNYYIDWYYSRKLGMAPTTGRPSNVVLVPGRESASAMLSRVKSGIFVTSFIGGNSNTLTGDFSMGLQGRAIENGKLTHAVAEMNLSGNHKTFWMKLAALGDDPWIHGSQRTPTMLFEGVAVSGA